MVSLGIIGPFMLGDNSHLGTTAEDRFFGIQDPNGVVAIRLTSAGGNTSIELDHVQFGTFGTNYCGPAVANSSGGPAEISGSGSASVANNNLTLEASGMPQNQFGYFLNSQTQANTFPVPNSQGVLCVGGAIGR